MNILTAKNQYGAYDEINNRNPDAPSFYNPVEWINSLPSPYREQQLESWNNALRLAKLIASAYGNPEYSDETKREIFESFVPNPFPETDANGNPVLPEDVTYFFSLRNTTANKPIDLGTDNKFGYTWRN
jgi:hypothetical protein